MLHRVVPLTASLASLCACQPAAPPPPRCPEPPRVDAAITQPTPPPATPDPEPPPARSSLPANCQAPLQATAEITRMLAEASFRATRSAACVDGPGTRVLIDDIHACPARPEGDERRFDVTYTVTRQTEGGRRACGADCPPRPVDSAPATLSVGFVAGADGFTLRVPAQVPGIAEMTPWDERHDGNCYGPLEPWQERAISLR